ncbi:MAG: acyloxyacyl hydrolase [Saprospiraceae bacterium]|nr:acyloxyacyl hydrolase [Saprospiraceae bacterium]
MNQFIRFNAVFTVMCCWLAAHTPLEAQKWSLEAAAYRGVIWRHTPKLSTRTGEVLWGQELGLRLQTLGRQSWEVWHRYPDLGLSFSHFRLGEGSHGEAYGLLPSLTVPIVRRPAWAVHFRVGTGLAWVTRPYDYFDNPGQNAIGSHWNNFTQFKLYGEYRPSPYWRVMAGYSLNHFSNGSGALPNFGVNLPSAFVSVAGQLRPLKHADFQTTEESRRPDRRWGFQAQAAQARVEFAVFDGPQYPIWIFTAAGHFHFTKVNRTLLGAEYENNVAVARWAWHVGDFASRSDARRAAQRLSVFLADEFLFGDFGVVLQAGYYVGAPINQFTLANWYSKLTSRYYFPTLPHTRIRPQAGVSLKAHKAVAEYISFNVGFAF